MTPLSMILKSSPAMHLYIILKITMFRMTISSLEVGGGVEREREREHASSQGQQNFKSGN